MPRVTHFEIHADDTARAIKFYQDIFSWKFDDWSGKGEYYILVTGPDTEPGINGGLMKRREGSPVYGQSVNSYVCTIVVDSVDNYEKKVTDNGGKVVVPKVPVPQVGYLLYCTDTEGNIFGMIQMDSSAK